MLATEDGTQLPPRAGFDTQESSDHGVSGSKKALLQAVSCRGLCSWWQWQEPYSDHQLAQSIALDSIEDGPRNRGMEDLASRYCRAWPKIFMVQWCLSGYMLAQYCSSPVMQKEVVNPSPFRSTLPFCFPKAAWEVLGKMNVSQRS